MNSSKTKQCCPDIWRLTRLEFSSAKIAGALLRMTTSFETRPFTIYVGYLIQRLAASKGFHRFPCMWTTLTRDFGGFGGCPSCGVMVEGRGVDTQQKTKIRHDRRRDG